MKYSKLSSALLALSVVAIPHHASAAVLLAGFYDFTNGNFQTQTTGTPSSPGFAATGFVGTVSSGNNTNLGGSNDGFYGSSNIAVPTIPGGDGNVRIGSNSPAYFSVTNLTSQEYFLQDLFFDAANSAGTDNQVSVSYQIAANHITTGAFIPLLISSPNPVTVTVDVLATAHADYQDFAMSLASVPVLAPGDAITFKFVANLNQFTNAIRIDNIGITAIPEPSSLLVLASLLGYGLVIRRRSSRFVSSAA